MSVFRNRIQLTFCNHRVQLWSQQLATTPTPLHQLCVANANSTSDVARPRQLLHNSARQCRHHCRDTSIRSRERSHAEFTSCATAPRFERSSLWRSGRQLWSPACGQLKERERLHVRLFADGVSGPPDATRRQKLRRRKTWGELPSQGDRHKTASSIVLLRLFSLAVHAKLNQFASDCTHHHCSTCPAQM